MSVRATHLGDDEWISSGDRPHPPIVTLAALYGAGGSVVGRRVAEQLDVPLIDRRIPEDVAKRFQVSEGAVQAVDDRPRRAIDRFVSNLGRASTVPGSADDLDLEEHRLRAYIEERLAETRVTGGVAVGRGGMIVLRSIPSALHVHLGGDRDARVRQGMELEGVDRDTAERHQEREDAARIEYVQNAYGVDGLDPSLYHLVLDSTALDLDVCVELIVAASRARTRQPRETAPT